MSEQRYTPGPWKAVKSDMLPAAWDVWSNGTGPFCVITGTEYADANGQADNAEANARLIAAAPDLLNALQVLADAAESRGIPADAARAAISKATPKEGR